MKKKRQSASPAAATVDGGYILPAPEEASGAPAPDNPPAFPVAGAVAPEETAAPAESEDAKESGPPPDAPDAPDVPDVPDVPPDAAAEAAEEPGEDAPGAIDDSVDPENAEDTENVEDAENNGEGEAAGEGENLLPFEGIVEALLFAAPEALTPRQIGKAIGRGTREKALRDAIESLNRHYQESGRAFEIAEVAGRFQILSRPEYAAPVRRLFPKPAGAEKDAEKEKSRGLTPAARDTLAIIVYKQPVTRAEIQAIRGVDCGPALRALVERGSVRIVGKKMDIPGQPLLYGTTELFLREYGLASLEEVPFLADMRWLTGVTEALPDAAAAPEPPAPASAAPVAENAPEGDNRDNE